MRGLLVLAAALASGCAMTIEELQRDGYRYERLSAQPSRAAANCVAQNIERRTPAWRASLRELAEAGHYQVHWVVRDAGGVLAVANVLPRPGGSSIELRTYPGVRDVYDSRAEEFLEGC